MRKGWDPRRWRRAQAADCLQRGSETETQRNGVGPIFTEFQGCLLFDALEMDFLTVC